MSEHQTISFSIYIIYINRLKKSPPITGSGSKHSRKGHNKKAFLGALPLSHIHRFCARISARACVPWVFPSQQRMFIEYLLIFSSFSGHPFQLYNIVQLRESEGKGIKTWKHPLTESNITHPFCLTNIIPIYTLFIIFQPSRIRNGAKEVQEEKLSYSPYCGLKFLKRRKETLGNFRVVAKRE